MKIYIAADHRGVSLAQKLMVYGRELGYDIEEVGGPTDPEDDYPDVAAAVAKRVSEVGEGARGVLLCGSGVGVDIAANRFPRVRSGLGMSATQVEHARMNDDINVLSLASAYVEEEDAKTMFKIFLTTPFKKEVERYVRRVDKLDRLPD